MTTEYFNLNVNKKDNNLYKGETYKTAYPSQPRIHMIKKPPEELEVGVHHIHDAGKNASSTKSNTLQACRLSTEANISIPSSQAKNIQLITVQQSHNDTVSSFTSGDSMKRDCSNCNITCTKTNAIKPNQISRSIRDIQGMLASNLNSKSTCLNKKSDANSNISDSALRKQSLNSLQIRNKYCLNNNHIQLTDTTIVKPIESTVSDSGVFSNYTIYDLAKPAVQYIQKQMLSDREKVMPERSVSQSESDNECLEVCFSGNINLFVTPSFNLSDIYNT